MPAEPSIVIEHRGEGMLQIRLNRPDRLSALGVDMVDVDARQQAIANAVAQGAPVLLVRGTVRASCAGADLKERCFMDDAAPVKHNRAINVAEKRPPRFTGGPAT